MQKVIFYNTSNRGREKKKNSNNNEIMTDEAIPRTGGSSHVHTCYTIATAAAAAASTKSQFISISTSTQMSNG